MKRRVTVCCSAGPRVRAGNKPSIAINEVLQSQSYARAFFLLKAAITAFSFKSLHTKLNLNRR